MKYCSKCDLTLSIGQFGKDKTQQDGLTRNCKPCRRQYSKLHHSANREKVNESNRVRYQRNKQAYSESGRRWQKQNADKIKEKTYRWRLENLDRSREISRLGSHRRRTRIAGGLVEKYSESQVLEKYGTNCHLCNLPINLSAPRRSGEVGWEMSLHIDHFLEISLGGNDTLENVRPSHGVCNIRKRRARKL